MEIEITAGVPIGRRDLFGNMMYNNVNYVVTTGIILCHNHPSGTLVASASDKQLTNKIKLAGETLDIKVLDHLIITEKTYFSFADEGLL